MATQYDHVADGAEGEGEAPLARSPAGALRRSKLIAACVCVAALVGVASRRVLVAGRERAFLSPPSGSLEGAISMTDVNVQIPPAYSANQEVTFYHDGQRMQARIPADLPAGATSFRVSVPGPDRLNLVVPPTWQPGQPVTFMAPNGRYYSAEVPAGVGPGQTMTVILTAEQQQPPVETPGEPQLYVTVPDTWDSYARPKVRFVAPNGQTYAADVPADKGPNDRFPVTLLPGMLEPPPGASETETTVAPLPQCPRETDGTCKIGSCSSSRGETECVDHKCICKENFCAKDGKCLSLEEYATVVMQEAQARSELPDAVMPSVATGASAIEEPVAQAGLTDYANMQTKSVDAAADANEVAKTQSAPASGAAAAPPAVPPSGVESGVLPDAVRADAVRAAPLPGGLDRPASALPTDVKKKFEEFTTALSGHAGDFETCAKALSLPAGKYTCQQRILYLTSKRSFALADAADQVATEHPHPCGGCGDVATMSHDQVKQMLSNSLPEAAKGAADDLERVKSMLSAEGQKAVDEAPDAEAKLKSLAFLTWKESGLTAALKAKSLPKAASFDGIFSQNLKALMPQRAKVNQLGFPIATKGDPHCGDSLVKCPEGSVCCGFECCAHDDTCFLPDKGTLPTCWSGKAKLPPGAKVIGKVFA